jgi:hypothetical protein
MSESELYFFLAKTSEEAQLKIWTLQALIETKSTFAAFPIKILRLSCRGQ